MTLQAEPFDDKRIGAELLPLGHGYQWVGLRGGEKAFRALAAGPDGHQQALRRVYEVRYEEPPTPNPNWLTVGTFREVFH